MANDITGDRLWICDTAAILAAVGVSVTVRKVIYFPAAVDNDILFQEYSSAAVLRTAFKLKAGPSVVLPLEIDFGPNGREFNGLKLATIDGGSVDIYLGR